MINLMLGDCLERMKELPDNSVDSCVTDPPYGLSDHSQKDTIACMSAWLEGKPYVHGKSGFMNRTWDSWVPGPEVWRQVYRVLKPGAYLLCFASTRTDDLMSLSLRLAGFRKHQSGVFCFGSGFPKATSLSKAFDKQAGVEREVVGVEDLAKQYEGWYYGLQALKPAMEPWLMFQKPHEGSMTDNVAKYGTGALNVNGCRVVTEESSQETGTKVDEGRWPANVFHDGSDEVIALFPDSKGQQGDVKGTEPSRTGGDNTNCYGEYGRVPQARRVESITTAARFFYGSKASKADREEGLETFEAVMVASSNQAQAQAARNIVHKGASGVNTVKIRKNYHPTVKSTALMSYLCRLVTPAGGVVIDPFMGSGSTGKGCAEEGFRFIGVEFEPGYFNIAKARIENAYYRDLI